MEQHTTPKRKVKIKVALESNSPHFWWIISILSAAIIALISFICTDKIVNAEVIANYISFASVLLSITLSIFAILYTYTSNDQTQRHFENINSAAESIKSTSNELISTNTRINESFKDIKKQWDDILGQLSDINKSQKEMKTQLNDMTNKAPISHISNSQQSHKEDDASLSNPELKK